MANLNKVMLIGRLTRDPEIRTFANGGKVAHFGFAVNNNRKNPNTGQWENEPVFLDMSVFNRGENGRQADLVEQSLRKGHQVFIEGRLKLEKWISKQDGQERSKLSVIVENFQFLEPRSEGAMGEGGARPVRSSAPMARKPAPQPSGESGYEEPMGDLEPEGHGGDGDPIPF